MHFFEKSVRWGLAMLLGAAAIIQLPVLSAAAQKNILILHSYHQTSEWTASIMTGMMEVLGDSALDLAFHVEYMDTDRHPPESCFEYLEDYYRSKYNNVPFSLILLSDNNALEFILSRRSSLFPGVPVVFCGINDFKEESLQGQSGITGVNEDIDIKGTIELALQIKPDIEDFLVINDATATGLKNRDKFNRDTAVFLGEGRRFTYMDDFSTSDLKSHLAGLSKKSAVLVLSFRRARDNPRASPRDNLLTVTENCDVPVFTLWMPDIEAGVLGGVMVSGNSQGKLAARYALRIIQGESPSSLPVEMRSPNVAVINYRQLERFGISVRSIPADVEIRFKPESIFVTYRLEIIGSAAVVVLLIAILLVLFKNIAGRRKIEKPLLEVREKLSNTLEMAHIGHWEYDTATGLLTFNDHFYAIFQTTAREAGGYTMTPDEYGRRFVHPDDMHIVGEEIRKALETPSPRYSRRIEHRMRYADGTTGHLAVRVSIMKDDRGRTVRIYGIAQDITELRQAEESIIKSEERWRLILQTAMDGFSLVNREGRLIEVNDTFCRMLGYTREELLDMHVSELVAGRTKDQTQAHIEKIIALGEDRFEAQHRRKDGKIIDTEISIQYQPTEGGLLCGFLRDITERRQIEARLHQSQKMEAVGTLAGGIAHDFNNILQPMLGFCELLKEDLPANAPEQGFVDGILKSALRAKDLVHQILSFSRQEGEEVRPIRLQPVIRDSMKLLRSSIPTTVDIQQNIDTDCGLVVADPTQVYQVVMNLCTNAYHAMENSGGTLKLALTQVHLEAHNPVFPDMVPGDYALLKVSDTGVGISRTMLGKIFDPYFTTKEKAKGTGLGLSIVQGIVKRYDGDIRIYSEPGKGTEIHVYLPIMKKGEGAGIAEENGRIQGGSERVLLVDDERPVAEMLHQMLERLGYRVTTRFGSMEALETFRTRPGDFDLVITDLTMPHMTGIQLAGELKQIRGDIPIILCTGFSEHAHQDRLNAVGIRAKLAKPVIARDLAETIRKVLTEVESAQ